MKRRFQCNVGLSDHTLGIGVAIASIALGAIVIEKHFCLSRAEGGVDSAFSLEPYEMKSLVEEAQRAYLALGKVSYEIQDAEKNNRMFKRSIYASKNIQAGEAFTPYNIKVIRPAFGMEPKYWDWLLTQKAEKEIEKGEPLDMSFNIVDY
jgi:N-acetylneuraminate synthase